MNYPVVERRQLRHADYGQLCRRRDADGSGEAFVAVTQNWFLVRNRWYEPIALLLICFTLFRPGYRLDLVDEPFVAKPVSQLNQTVDATPAGQAVRLKLKTFNINGDEIEKLVRLSISPKARMPQSDWRALDCL